MDSCGGQLLDRRYRAGTPNEAAHTLESSILLKTSDILNLWSNRRWIAAGLFPIVLWFVATFFLLGDIGKWNDDWYYLLRDPESKEIQGLYLTRDLHFWRPLYRAVVPALQTLLWEHDPLNHLISATVHGLNSLLLWALARRFGATRLAAALCGLAFLVFPAPYEVVFWLCSLPTGLSLGLMLLAMHLCVSWARSYPSRASFGLVAPIVFSAASLNEQPACALLVLPVVYLAALRHASPVARQSIVNAALIFAFGLASLVAYTVAHKVLIAAPTALGRDGFVVPAQEIPSQLSRLCGWLKMQMFSADFARRALERAAEAASLHPVRSVVAMGALIASSMGWVVFQVRHGHEARERSTHEPWALALLALPSFLPPGCPSSHSTIG